MKISDEFRKACGIGGKRHSGFYEPQESTEENRFDSVSDTKNGHFRYPLNPKTGKHDRIWVEEDPESDE